MTASDTSPSAPAQLAVDATFEAALNAVAETASYAELAHILAPNATAAPSEFARAYARCLALYADAVARGREEVLGAYICAHCAAMSPASTDMLDCGQTYRCGECNRDTAVMLVKASDYGRALAATLTPANGGAE